MSELPVGTLTFLFTDIAGSTRLWEQHPTIMPHAHARHLELIVAAVEAHNGQFVRTRGEGDSTFSVFASAPDALAAACAFQRALHAEPWPPQTPLRVRAALHTGMAELRDGDYNASAVNRCARLRAIAHGGQTVISRATYELVRDALPEGVSLRDMGLHRLKDLERAEQVYQLLHPALPAEFPPLKSLDLYPTNLPQQVSSFIGREREMAEIKGLLSTTRLLTLTGSGGAGKTRLALQVGADLLEEFNDGVWLVELAALSEAALVAPAVASALGVVEEPGQPLADTLAGALKPMRLLLILDNCEHLIGACADLVALLLRSVPGLRVLATSREALRVPGEVAWRVPSLTLPEPSRLPPLESLTQYEAVRLFIERAGAVSATFRVTHQNAPALAQVCHRLDGIPLAIELAAARVRALSVEQIASRLDDRFRLLTGGSRGALPRQQTLRALIDWSYDLLSESERWLLGRLSVFAGGWTLEAAEAVCAGEGLEEWEVLDLLTSLVDKSLALAEETKEGAMRYRLLETVRQYSREKLLESGEAAAFLGRHRAWCLSLAEAAEPQLHGPEQVLWLDRLEAEHDNLREALRLPAERETGSDAAEASLRLAVALAPFWRVRGYLTEGRAHLSAALARTEGQPRAEARVKALHVTGELTYSQGDYPAARALFEESLAIRREAGDRAGIASSLNNLGNVALDQGDYAAARAFYEESLAMNRESGDKKSIAISLNNLGAVVKEQGDYATAHSLYEESLAIKRELGDKRGCGVSLNNLGLIAADQGDYTTARALYEQSLALRRELGDKAGMASSLNNLGNVALSQGDYASAQALYEESLALRKELGDKAGIVIALHNLANIAYQQQDFASARTLYEESLNLSAELLIRGMIAYNLNGFAGLASANGQRERAVRLYGAAESLREAIGAPLAPGDREALDQELAELRGALGAEAFTAAWEEGSAFSLEQALAEALHETA